MNTMYKIQDDTIGRLAVNLQYSSRYFHSNRTQPFIVTLFMAVMALKKVCKKIKMNIYKKKTNRANKLSDFKQALKSSNYQATMATKGSNENFLSKRLVGNNSVLSMELSRNISNDDLMNSKSTTLSLLELKKQQAATSLIRKIEKRIVDQNNLMRRGKGFIKVERLLKTLDNFQDISGALFANNILLNHEDQLKEDNDQTQLRRRGHLNVGDVKDIFMNHERLIQLNEIAAADDDRSIEKDTEKVIGYPSDTTIFYGATICIQARHGGYLSYTNEQEIKASAHKMLKNTYFVVKNSEKVGDVGEMKYGDSIWLQTVNSGEVLGAHYGTLKKDRNGISNIKPILIACSNPQQTFKAHQYGRWIVLKKDDPIGTLGKTVLNHHRLIFEQGWYFLASVSPYESSMRKIVDNPEDAMTTDRDIFQPSEDCEWKIHIVALPSYDQADEQKRMGILMTAQDQIAKSDVTRKEKFRSLLLPITSKIRPELLDQNVFSNNLSHKKNARSNYENMLNIYKTLGRNGFEPINNSSKILERTYGRDSNIVRYHDDINHMRGLEWNIKNFQKPEEKLAIEHSALIEEAHSDYWKMAQKILVNTKSWMQLSDVMFEYYKINREKKIKAALVLQRAVRNFMERKFNFERSMTVIDKRSQKEIQEKIINDRKIIAEQLQTKELLKQIALGGGSIHSEKKRVSKKVNALANRKSITSNGNSEEKSFVDFELTYSVSIQSFSNSMTNANGTPLVVKKLNTSNNNNDKRNSLSKSFSNNDVTVYRDEIDDIVVRPKTASPIDASNMNANNNETFDKSDINNTNINVSNILELKKISKKEKILIEKQDAISKLGTNNNKFGLPDDIFECHQSKSNLKTGIRFLQAISPKRIYNDIKTRKK